MLQDGEVERYAAFDHVFVQHLQHAPEAYSVAIVAVGILLCIGIGGTRPWVSDSVIVRQILVVLDVGCYPQGNAGIVGPLDNWPVNNWAVVYTIRGQWHREHLLDRLFT
jgi:hypothetical protein